MAIARDLRVLGVDTTPSSVRRLVKGQGAYAEPAVPYIAPDIEPLERSEGILPQDIDPAVYAEVVELAMLDFQHRLGLEDISSI